MSKATRSLFRPVGGGGKCTTIMFLRQKYHSKTMRGLIPSLSLSEKNQCSSHFSEKSPGGTT